jgi:membrane-associated protease RseP (regulator of RpoE activity)
MLLVVTSSVIWAEAVPKGVFKALESEDFKLRESAQMDVLVWARKNPRVAVNELLRLSADSGSPSPEVRERCMQVLRQLAADEFATEGDGYVGISMRDQMVRVPGEQSDRWAVMVMEVVADSAAAESGLSAGDVIVELDGQRWKQEASNLFSEQIRKHKPGARVRLGVLRDGKLLNISVKLRRRPAHADQFMLGVDADEQKAMEQQAMEVHFERWLIEKRALNEANGILEIDK